MRHRPLLICLGTAAAASLGARTGISNTECSVTSTLLNQSTLNGTCYITRTSPSMWAVAPDGLALRRLSASSQPGTLTHYSATVHPTVSTGVGEPSSNPP